LQIKDDRTEEGEMDMAVRREERDQREQAAQEEDDPALNVK
jgi:hypothetical protein